MRTKCDHYTFAAMLAELACVARCVPSLGRANHYEITGRRSPRVARFFRVNSEHGRQPGIDCIIGCAFGLGAGVDRQAVAVGIAKEREILPDVEGMVSVSVCADLLGSCNHATNEPARNTASDVREVTCLVESGELLERQSGEIFAVLAE